MFPCQFSSRIQERRFFLKGKKIVPKNPILVRNPLPIGKFSKERTLKERAWRPTTTSELRFFFERKECFARKLKWIAYVLLSGEMKSECIPIYTVQNVNLTINPFRAAYFFESKERLRIYCLQSQHARCVVLVSGDPDVERLNPRLRLLS